MLALGSSVLSSHLLNEMRLPDTLVSINTALGRAAAKDIPETRAVNWARGCAWARLSEAAAISEVALLATEGSLMGDCEELLVDSISASGGALAELAPVSFAILRAAVLVASLLSNFSIKVWALLTIALSRDRDVEGLLLCADCTVSTAILALLGALVKLTPFTFAIHRAAHLCAWPVLHVFMFELALDATMLCCHSDHELARLAAASARGTTSTPFCEVSFAIHWAGAITTRLGLLVHVGVVAFFASELRLTSNNEGLGLGASSTEVATRVGNLCIARCVVSPVADARDGASRLLTQSPAWISAVIRHWRAVLALQTAVLGGGDLNPLSVLPDNLFVLVAAVSIALPIFSPSTHSINWAWLGFWVARPDLNLANVFTLLASMLSILSDLEPASLIAIRAALCCAGLPWQPITNTRDRAWLLIAHLMLHGSSLGLAFLSTVKSWLCHNEGGLLSAASTINTAFTELGPVTFTVHWARCFTAGCFINCSIRSSAAFTTAFLFNFHSECPALGAASAASDLAITISLKPLELVTSALTPFTPTAFAIDCAARQLA
jgi:hypothetical protein